MLQRHKDPPAQNILVYSKGHDGSDRVFNGLRAHFQNNDEVTVRRVFTLNPDRVTRAMMAREQDSIPDHIRVSDMILREERHKQTPYHLISMVSDPLLCHASRCLSSLSDKLPADSLFRVLASPRWSFRYFSSYAPNITTQWFENEYIPSTGIDLFSTPFDTDRGFRILGRGPHRLLILSSNLSPYRQSLIISKFLGRAIPPIEGAEVPHTLEVQQFIASLWRHQPDWLTKLFWDSPETRYFFSPAQREAFKATHARTTARMELFLPEQEDNLSPAGLIERVMFERDTPRADLPVHATIEELLTSLGHPGGIGTIEKAVQYADRARDTLLLNTLRVLGRLDLPAAISFGEKWIGTNRDQRFTKSLYDLMLRKGHIKKPLALLEAHPITDDAIQAVVAVNKPKLLALNNLLTTHYPFTPQPPKTLRPPSQTIIYNAHQALPFHGSGYATRTQGILTALMSKGWNMQCCLRHGYPVDTGHGAPEALTYTLDNISYHLEFADGQGHKDLPVTDYIDIAAKSLVARATPLNPRLIHTASNYMCGLAGVEAARRMGIPSIYEMRGLWHVTHWSKDPSYGDTDKYALAQKMELECAAAADHVLAITGALREWLIEHGIDPQKITVAPNAVNLEQFQNQPYNLELAMQMGCAGSIVIGYIGSFVHYEGLDILIEALTHLPLSVRAQIKLLWLGDGPALPDLLQKARVLGVDHMILALGRRPFHEVPGLYSLVDIAAFPRKGVPVCEIISPLKPFEAMAMKKAVIVSNVRPLAEIVEDGVTGLIHEKDNAASLAHALQRFIEDPALRTACGQAAYEWIEKTRQWDIITEAIDNVYEFLT